MDRRSTGISREAFRDGFIAAKTVARSWRQVGAGLPAKHAAMCWQLAYNPYDKDSIFAAFGDVARGHTAGPPGQGAIYVTLRQGRYLGRGRAAKARHEMAATAGNSRSVGSGG